MHTAEENGLSIFTNEEFGQVRVVMRDGEPWFVASDVCSILALENVSRALGSLDIDEKSVVQTLTNSKVVNNPGDLRSSSRIISESGLYVLVLKSRKPEAKKFKRWITHEVLPSLRKTGKYEIAPQHPKLPQTYLEALKALVASEEEKQAAIERERLALEQNEQLREVIGCATEWKQVMGIDWLADVFDIKNQMMYVKVGHELSALSRAMGKEIRKAPHPKYPNGVNVYHISVVEAFRQRVMLDARYLAQFRKALPDEQLVLSTY